MPRQDHAQTALDRVDDGTVDPATLDYIHQQTVAPITPKENPAFDDIIKKRLEDDAEDIG